MISATISLNGWTRFVDREIDHSRSVGQLRPPVIKLRGQHFALQPVTLPVRKVRILNRQLFQRRFLARSERLVECATSSIRTPMDHPSLTM